MDIKDFILIVGGLLIAAVIAHGFWIAWRARREPLRLDIVPELVPEDHDEMDRFRGELPNGGARPVLSEQESFQLESQYGADAPVLLEPSQAGAQARAALDRELLGDPAEREPAIAKKAPPPRASRVPKGPDLFTIPEGYGPDEDEPVIDPAAASEPQLPRVAEVSLPETEPQTDEVADPLFTEAKPRPELRPRRAANQPMTDRRSKERKPRRLSGSGRKAVPEPEQEAEPAAVEELIMIHLIAPRGQSFDGPQLFETMRGQSLKFGDMNIFHRTDPMLKSPVFSVANAVEPGFFDLSDIESMTTPGVTFFLQLPGPEEPSAALEDMLDAAQAMAHELGGQLRDESRNRLTRQTANHMRQRVSDFALKRLSRKAL